MRDISEYKTWRGLQEELQIAMRHVNKADKIYINAMCQFFSLTKLPCL